jgi:hypothetical protein
VKLSIVICDNHKNFRLESKREIRVQKLSKDVELVGPVPGPSVASMRNLGAEKSDGNWIFFIDWDVQADTHKLLKLIHCIESRNLPIKALGGLYKAHNPNFLGKAYNLMQRTWVLNGLSQDKNLAPFKEGKHLLGGALLVHRPSFFKVGGFDELIGWGADELEFLERLRGYGYQSAVSYSLVVPDLKNPGLLGYLKRAWYQNFNRTYFGLESQPEGRGFLQYFRSPKRYWPLLLTFFGVAQLASTSGTIRASYRQRWKY